MVVTINGNCRNTPVEVFETRYPAFRIERYRLTPDSGGPGRYRGGLGGERIFTVTVPEVTVSALLNRMRTEPWGILGGRAGGVGGLWVRRAGTGEWRTFVEEFGTMSPSKFSGVTLREGDQVKIQMPGGGGYGEPADRDVEMVKRDLAEGFITPKGARDQYGYEEGSDLDG
jgi:N-methylhydantoinase B/oxoprolinase/acetone carboxylase alpha subunit